MEVYVAGVLRRLASATSAASMASRVTVPQMFRIYMVKILAQTVFAFTIFSQVARRVIETQILTKIMTFSKIRRQKRNKRHRNSMINEVVTVRAPL